MEKKYLNLRGISEILSEKEMRSVVGSSGGSGSGGPCWVSWICFCQEHQYVDNPPYSDVGSGPCANAPWDRNPNCTTGYQDCWFTHW